MIFLLLACTAPDCVSEPRDFEPSLGVVFADPRFSAGALAHGDQAGVECPAVETSGDAAVRSADGVLYTLDRDPEIGDVLTAYEPADLNRPLWQTHLGYDLNPHDVVARGDRLYLPHFDGERIGVLDLDGTEISSIPAPSGAALDRAVVVGETLWVADQRFDRSTSVWVSDGVLLEVVDAIVSEVPTGPNPRISDAGDGRLLIATGHFAFDDDAAVRRDGELRWFDTATRSFSAPLVTEAELDADIHGAVVVGDSVVLSAVDASGASRIHCVGVGDGPSSGAWYVELAVLDGAVVVAARTNPVGTTEVSDRGLFLVDPETCTHLDDIPMPNRDPYGVVSL